MEKRAENPWAEYTNNYRKRNPEKVARWRYNQSKRYVQQYEQEHPEVLKEKQEGTERP